MTAIGVIVGVLGAAAVLLGLMRLSNLGDASVLIGGLLVVAAGVVVAYLAKRAG